MVAGPHGACVKVALVGKKAKRGFRVLQPVFASPVRHLVSATTPSSTDGGGIYITIQGCRAQGQAANLCLGGRRKKFLPSLLLSEFVQRE
jgi:hypothetical protein